MNASDRASVGQVAVDFDQNRDVGYWPEASLAAMPRFRRYQMNSGLVLDIVNLALVTRCMVRPCVARDFVEMTVAVLHQCIRPSIGACLLRAIMDISARAISLAVRPRLGHLGHQCSHAPGRPNLHLFSSSRRPRQVSRIDLATSSRAPDVVHSLWWSE